MKKNHPGVKFTKPNQVNLVGKKFGKLEVLQAAEPIKTGGKTKSRWLCKCDCGKETIKRADTLSAGTTQSCGCKPYEAKKDITEMGIRIVKEDYKNNCKRRGLLFDLDDNDFKNLILANCHYCNKEPSQTRKGRLTHAKIVYNGIDRKDNLIGYTKENCVSCCKECNFLKTDKTYEQFLNKIKSIYENRIQGIIDVEK